MEIRFADEKLKKLIIDDTAEDRKLAKFLKNRKYMEKLRFQTDLIRAASSFEQLYSISPLHYEQLKHSLSGCTSFRITQNRVERVICKEENEILELILIEIDDTHYGTKK